MMKRKVLVCLMAFSLLLAWLSPVGLAQPPVTKDTGVININAATLDEMVKLPRVGQKVAERIISYRKKNGPFKKPEDLMAVRGIGEKVFQQIRPRISLK